MAAPAINGGNPVDRNKGSYSQPGQLIVIPKHSGATNGVSVDGVLECDTAYLQSEFPLLFAVLGTVFNKASDDNATDVRTPPAPALFQDEQDWTVKVRY